MIHGFKINAVIGSVVPASLEIVERNVKTFPEAKLFFRPSLESLHDPFLMDNMEEATTRLIEALTENQLVCIYGDYDVDGTCSIPDKPEPRVLPGTLFSEVRTFLSRG